MKFPNITNEMRANGVEEEHIKSIIESCKKSKFSLESIDKELVKVGYEEIFTIDYDDFASSEKIFRKHNNES